MNNLIGNGNFKVLVASILELISVTKCEKNWCPQF